MLAKVEAPKAVRDLKRGTRLQHARHSNSGDDALCKLTYPRTCSSYIHKIPDQVLMLPCKRPQRHFRLPNRSRQVRGKADTPAAVDGKLRTGLKDATGYRMLKIAGQV